MLSALRRSIAISEGFLSDLGARPNPTPRRSSDERAKALLTAIASSGIPKFQHPRVTSDLADALHNAAQSHFQSACLALQATHGSADLASLQKLALQLQSTFTKLHEKKISEAASRTLSHPKEKQPFSTDVLLYAFDQTQSPNKRERQALASLTGLTLEQVRVWFQNRRQRMKKRAPELQPRATLQLDDVLARVAAYRKAADEDFDDNDSGYCSDSDRNRSATPLNTSVPHSLTVHSSTPRSYPAPYQGRELSTEFHCEPPNFLRVAAKYPPIHAQTATTAELCREMSRLTLRHRRQAPRSSTSSSISVATTAKSTVRSKKAVASNSVPPNGDLHTRKKPTCKVPETGRKVAGRRTASTASTASSTSSSSTSPSPALSDTTDASPKTRKRLGPLRRKPAGKVLARQASGSSVASNSSNSSRSTSYSSDFSLASDSSFTSVESAPTAASMDCFQPQQQPQFDPLAAFDFTQLFSSQPSDPLPQPVADFELPPELLAGLQMPMDTAALPPPESTDFLALLNDPTIQDLLQSVQDMDVVAPQQTQESLTFNNTFDVGSVDTSAFLDLSASTLPTFDAMFGLDTSSFQDTLWNSPGFSLPITV